MTPSIDEFTELKAGANTHWKQVNGEGVVVDFTTGNYYVLDDVSAFFWQQMIQRPLTLPELVEATLEEYEAEAEQVAENARNFCHYMLGERLLEVSGRRA